MAPIIDSLAAANNAQIVFVKIDGGEQTDICKELKAEGFPTFIIYKQDREVWRKQGIAMANELTAHF